ncbi:MAG: SDR family NAD(P)-dependent oxidoreductase [Proteobacteria bacterium]|nr:SDR family NAD(P)-dependent oxidoreductase [Pseudomonadota bacterium]
MEIQDKVVVITGGANGIGKALAIRFKAAGAKHIVVADLDGAGASAVAREVDGTAEQIDVSREADIQRVIETTENTIGPIDLFCSNAGIAKADSLDSPNDEWQLIWDVNVMSHMYAARHLVPRMVKRGGGYLLNTCSAAGLLNQIGGAAYGVTKHAAVGLGEWIALTYAHQGIRVSLLCPQAVRTAMTSGEAMNNKGIAAAAADGMIEAEVLAESVIEGLADERFLILPHPEVVTYMQRKTADYDRWIRGMNRFHQSLYADEAKT